MIFMRYAAFLFLLGLAHPVQAQLQVESMSPTPEGLQVAAETAITVQFNQAVNPETFDARSVMVQGRWSGVVPGTMTFEDNNRRLRFLPDRPFFAGEMVTVNLARHLESSDGEAMTHGYAWQFWIRTRAAFADLQETARLPVRTEQEGRIQTYGAYAGDLNADGFSDFIVPNEISQDVRVFMNDGQGNYDEFTIYDLPNGARPSTNEGADFNHDGHLDFAVGNSANDQVSVFLGDGTGRLSGPTDYTTDDGVRGLTLLDANGDGSIDIATAHRDDGTVRLLLNNGDGTFTVTAAIELRSATAITAADANGDGIL
ncbi:MAG TPA: FG-GAP-like repeat-containing protein, partial [Rhodothermales bacterium]|nr:FG-GAP-like repeat-containing protein [Rhodothermales bacterium]